MGRSFFTNCFFKLVIYVLAICSLTFAHGGVWVDVHYEVLFDSSGFVGIRNHWTFDKEYSANAMMDVDLNGNGIIDEKEMPILKKSIVDSLLEKNYYNYVLSGSRFLNAEGISNFKSSIQSEQLTIDFTVLFSEAAVADYTMLVIVVYDTHSKMMMDVDTDGTKVEFPKCLNVEYFSDGLKGISMLKAFDSSVRGTFLRYKKLDINAK